ncbi:MAG: hypothetical protein GWN33_11525 [Gammaproteobacteria bacterium]|nr:hypothetical protein [Desulfobacterales bacterium]NIW11107.1 hypothetical protein [Gammaproteobacteria bacterium]
MSEVELRKKYGVTLLAIRRDKEILSNPGADTRIEAGDILVLLARIGKLADITTLLQEGDVQK